jgi:hypothetical protein
VRRRIKARLCDEDSAEDRRPMSPSRVKWVFIVVLVLLCRGTRPGEHLPQVPREFVVAKDQFVLARETSERLQCCESSFQLGSLRGSQAAVPRILLWIIEVECRLISYSHTSTFSELPHLFIQQVDIDLPASQKRSLRDLSAQNQFASTKFHPPLHFDQQQFT